MRHGDENYYQTFPVDQYTTLLQRHKVSVIDDANQVKQAIKEAETTCHFSIWHVVATVSNHGYVLFMIQNVFDPTQIQNGMQNTLTELQDPYRK